MSPALRLLRAARYSRVCRELPVTAQAGSHQSHQAQRLRLGCRRRVHVLAPLPAACYAGSSTPNSLLQPLLSPAPQCRLFLPFLGCLATWASRLRKRVCSKTVPQRPLPVVPRRRHQPTVTNRQRGFSSVSNFTTLKFTFSYTLYGKEKVDSKSRHTEQWEKTTGNTGQPPPPATAAGVPFSARSSNPHQEDAVWGQSEAPAAAGDLLPGASQ